MTVATAISVFFGLVAALALLSCHASIRYGMIRWQETRAQLKAIDRAPAIAPRPLRRPQEAFAQLAA